MLFTNFFLWRILNIVYFQSLRKNRFIETTTVKDPLIDKESAWTSFRNIVRNFFGNPKAENYEQPFNSLQGYWMQSSHRCNMPIKIHFLYFHLDFYPQNLPLAMNDILIQHRKTNAVQACYLTTVGHSKPDAKYSRKYRIKVKCKLFFLIRCNF